MRYSLLYVVVAVVAMTGPQAQARDTELTLPISDALSDGEIKHKIPTDVTYHFLGQPSPVVARTFGEYVTNRKTNSVGRPDAVACRWAMLSALIQLSERARQLGGNGIINIVSYYKKNTQGSATDYVCHAGAVVAGVALKGTVVSLTGRPKQP